MTRELYYVIVTYVSPHLHRISSVSNLNYKNLHDGNLVHLPYMTHLTDVLDTHLVHTLVLVKSLQNLHASILCPDHTFSSAMLSSTLHYLSFAHRHRHQ